MRLLQWGRGGEAAERTGTVAANEPAHELQWGRGKGYLCLRGGGCTTPPADRTEDHRRQQAHARDRWRSSAGDAEDEGLALTEAERGKSGGEKYSSVNILSNIFVYRILTSLRPQ